MNEKLKYNILVIDDDPLVLEDAVLMYKDMIFLGDFDDILGKGSVGSVSSAKNTKEAERILQVNFEKDRKLVQLLHVDERMPGERGSEFVDRMRWAYAGKRIGALLVTGYATDISVINSREKGVYRYLSKPVTPNIVKPAFEGLVRLILSREKPVKRNLENPFVFRVLRTKEEIVAAGQLRYSVYDFHVPYKNPQRFEFDEYDKYAIPMGGFSVENSGGAKLVSFLRLITRNVDDVYYRYLQDIVKEFQVDVLRDVIKNYTMIPFPTSKEILEQRDYPAAAKDLIKKFNASIDTCELSRTISHPDYRGLDLSRKIMEFGIAASLSRDLNRAIGSNDPRLTPMYNKYGYYTNPEIPRIDNKSVAFVSDVVIADFRELPEPTNLNVQNIGKKFKKDGFFSVISG